MRSQGAGNVRGQPACEALVAANSAAWRIATRGTEAGEKLSVQIRATVRGGSPRRHRPGTTTGCSSNGELVVFGGDLVLMLSEPAWVVVAKLRTITPC
jgi:hypothetical protein